MLVQGTLLEEKYQIIEMIGKGGMGSVYLAKDINTHVEYAIKEQIINRSNEQLLRQETAILLKLNHVFLPKAYHVLVRQDILYIIMEYIKGETLESLLKRRDVIQEKIAIKWFRQISDVLVYLHGLEVPIVYRDLKPANIMIQPNGDIKIIDFGIAQEYGKHHTEKKVLALTRGYAAPEQYDDRYRDDVRTDIYALGVTMHYILTGKNPNQPPYHFRPVRKLNASVSLAAEFIISKCLQPNPDKRYRTALELHEELGNIQELERRLQKKRKKKCILMIASGVSIMCVAMLVFFEVKRQRESKIGNYYQYLESAHIYEESGEYEEAMSTYEKAIDMQPDAWDAYLGKARLYLQYGEYSECQQWMKVTAEKFPDIFEEKEFREILDTLYENGR